MTSANSPDSITVAEPIFSSPTIATIMVPMGTGKPSAMAVP